MNQTPIAANQITPPQKNSVYPDPFASMMEGRTKRKLGDYFGLSNFGINLTQLAPGAISALCHHHKKQDEFIFILEGNPTLILNDKEFLLEPGECMGIKASSGLAAQLINHSDDIVNYLEIGDRSPGDEVEYPHDDLKAEQQIDGSWKFLHKNGEPY